MSTGFYVTYVALWGLVIFQSLVMYGMLRTLIELRQRLEVPANTGAGAFGELPPGAEVPDFTARELGTGKTLRRAELSGRRRLLLFLSSHCTLCESLLTEARGLKLQAGPHLVAFCLGEAADCASHLESSGLGITAVHDVDRAITESFGVRYTPTAVLIDEQLRVISYHSPQKAEELEQLLEEVARPSA